MDIIQVITKELNVEKWQVEAAVKLIDEGNTIPFIARYRKEMTGAMDDQKLREISERLGIAQSTVENHIYLALKALRSKLSKSELLMLLFFIFLCNNSQSFG